MIIIDIEGFRYRCVRCVMYYFINISLILDRVDLASFLHYSKQEKLYIVLANFIFFN